MDVQTDQAALSAHDTRRRVFAIVGASSGNLVEWFDFYIYSFCALYFAPAFFPSGNSTTQLLNTAGVFAAGFLMRPIGGWLFGRIADRHGRRAAMMISVLMMCGGSLVIAVLPTYAQIGALAPALLLVARLFQGLSVGGEYGTSATYMSEVALKGRRGFFASFQYVTLIGGQLCALLVLVILQQTLSTDELKAWGWRIPFVCGAAAALISLYLRKSLDETSTSASRDKKDAGTIRGVWQHKGAFFTVVGFTAGGSLIFYTFTTYMQKYLVNTAGMHAKTASNVMTVALLVYMLIQPVFGALSDKIGRRTSMILFGTFAVIGTVPLMHTLKTVTSPMAAFVLITIALAIVSFYTSISGLIKAEMFPPEVRAMGVGLSYAVANAIFGGSAEYVALWFKSVGSEETFYWYVTALCAVSLIVSWRMRDPSKEGYLRHEP
ncbi:MFS transporter, metabolite:H+ symporter family protein [Burkholderia ambifaria AMMD]|uniref:Alpha-ketoglutarate permease n=1 Tax=Burkholderia ambifaria (strain ATCC BAA-244 / DSM 16087 / CCUG 44356 / LMG 19182 / AMMD) TaxID=339670 RepID=Q0BFK2_BURCM|nr:MFS family transporter [Burkholderia ambifaria]ABI87071.1 metabolite/H+ symporter, major facilitator superfamily (MFS) [Burkholderia ambifaria AMMD]AJY21828.1 MFS transporter, metabolite:H+ symporter family protein [Burkholderia ambifaria AMMD]MBR7928561.1 metabolite/H+ symporter [Burkholderia ambifaria]MBR8226089.1 metabolite/H+ symporter [Burkholderia ambifaria]MBR8344292.1 metabolite/H+ symporter [Burkholderia ambifaria]